MAKTPQLPVAIVRSKTGFKNHHFTCEAHFFDPVAD